MDHLIKWISGALIGAALLGMLAGCGSSSSDSSSARAPEATPVLHRPRTAWIAPNPGNVSQGGPYVSYEGLAMSGNVIVGVTFASREGSLLARLNPANGEPLWTASLPSYAERNAIAIKDGRILMVAPGRKLSREEAEGEGPALVYAFSLDGAKLWQHSLGIAIAGNREGTEWAPPTLPDGGENYPEVLTDFNQIAGTIILYDGHQLRGISESDGSEWSYVPAVAPEQIVGPDPGGAEDLHLVNGTDVILIDGHTGVEKGRSRSAPKGRAIGLIGPIFQRRAAEEESPVEVPDIGPVTPLPAFAGDVVYGGTKQGLVAIDTQTGKELWTLRDTIPYGIETAAAGDRAVLATDSEATFLLRENK